MLMIVTHDYKEYRQWIRTHMPYHQNDPIRLDNQYPNITPENVESTLSIERKTPFIDPFGTDLGRYNEFFRLRFLQLVAKEER